MRIEFKLQVNALSLLLFANLLIFVLALLVQLRWGFDDQLFYLFGGLVSYRVHAGDLWLLLSSAFFHLDILHFLLNFYALYRIGQIVMYYYSGRTLFVVYILGAIAGSLVSYAATLFLGNSPYSLGASGAIFALIGLLVGGSLRKYRYGMELPFSIWDILPVVLFSLWIGFLPGSRINNWAHLGGLFAGTLLGLILKHEMSGYRSKAERILEKVLYYICSLLLLGTFIALVYNVVSVLFN